MTNPTTYFGWQMPEPTDLVTDLPADFEVFGQAVDTDLQDLLGGTTGQVLSKTSGTDLDFTWVDPTAGDITGVTAGTGISGGGTSGTVTVTNSMATAIDAKGDLIAGTADDTFSSLSVGANDTVLTADSTTPTGLKWATPASGGMTLLSTTTLSGATTTISSIDQTYKSIVLYFYGVNAGTGSSLYINPNANTVLVSQITNYGENGSVYAITHNNSQLQLPGNLGTNKPDNAFTLQFDNYASATSFKPFNFYGYYEYHSPAIKACFHSGGAYRSTSAISSIDINIASGTFTAGTVKLYGVN
jgi:hypothetical protein